VTLDILLVQSRIANEAPGLLGAGHVSQRRITVAMPALDVILGFYARHSETTDPGSFAAVLEGLPTEPAALCRLVQGVLLHIFWAERYGASLSEERKQEVNLRRVERMLGRALELDPRPLTEARPLGRRLVGNCRDFSVLACAVLRHQGVPARARCGFGAYFRPGGYEDHWVCEYWDGAAGRWVMFDSQLDETQREVLKIDFDPLDMPAGRFLTGGQAWQMCRSGREDPDKFGIFDMRGQWFVAGNLVRDFLALNKVEILPWDSWGLMYGPEGTPEEQLTTLDRLAELSLGGNEASDEVRRAYLSEPRLSVAPRGFQA